MTTRVVPLLAVSVVALAVAPVLLARGADTSADSAKARTAVAAPRVTHRRPAQAPAPRGRQGDAWSPCPT